MVQQTDAPPHPWHALGRHFAEVQSTMSVVGALAESGAPEGTHVVATAQSRGQGRRGRIWLSAHAGVYLTILLRPSPCANLAGLPLVFGRATFDAVVAYAPTHAFNAAAVAPKLGLKWPNDLMAHGRKLGGVLLQAKGLETAHPWVLVGIGINVTPQAGVSLAPDVQARYIGIMDLLGPTSTQNAHRASPEAFRPCVTELTQHTVATCYQAYRQWQQHGLAPTINRWLQHDVLFGHSVQATVSGRPVVGQAAGIDACGRLALKVGTRTLWVESGEIEAVAPKAGQRPDAIDTTPTAIYSGLCGESS